MYLCACGWGGRGGLEGLARFVCVCVCVSVPVPVLVCTYVCFE